MMNREEILAFLESLVQKMGVTIPKLIFLVLLFIIVLRVAKFMVRRFKRGIIHQIDKTENKQENEKRANTLFGLLNGAVTTGLWVIFIMIFLKEIGLNIGPLLAGAGILGLAIGFGAQELVRDGISGFFLLLEDRVRTGDVAIVNGTGGLVEALNLRTITLRDLSGVVHTFQNGKIDTLANMTKDWSAMVFDIGVAYKENVDQVIMLIKEVGTQLQEDEAYKANFVEPIEIFGLDKFGDSAVIIKARIKTKPSAQWTIGREFNKRIKQVFDEKGIEIPFPHRTIYWGDAIAPLNLRMESMD